MLNPNQQKFLERYINDRGDVDKVLKSMSLSMHHLLSWRRNREFDIIYRDVQRQLINHLNSENYLMGVKRLNEILNKGYEDEIVSTKQRVIQRPIKDDDGNDSLVSVVATEVDRKVIKKAIPSSMIALALQQNSLIQAINILSAQGILSDNVARKLLAKSDEIAGEMKKVFDGDNENNQMSQTKAVELMKTAILKGIQ